VPVIITDSLTSFIRDHVRCFTSRPGPGELQGVSPTDEEVSEVRVGSYQVLADYLIAFGPRSPEVPQGPC
jgi:hypothetical protein